MYSVAVELTIRWTARPDHLERAVNCLLDNQTSIEVFIKHI